MNPRTSIRMLLAVGIAIACGTQASAAVDKARAAAEIKAAVATIVAGINAHDPAATTAYDATDVVGMEGGSPDKIGAADDRAGFKMAFGYAPSWRVSLVEEHVDVADSGEMALYRSTYNEDSVNDGVPMTHHTHFIAEFKRDAEGGWKMAWYVVSPTERSHKK